MRRFLLTAALVGALVAPAFAQVVQNQVSGNEVWSAAQGPGGPSNFLSVQSVRNSSALLLVSGSGAATTVMTAQQSTLMWKGTAPTTWAVTLPPSPIDGSIVTIGTNTTLTTMVTVTAAAGTSLSPAYSAQTITAATSAQWQYSLADTTWYRLR
jgi:hypothetical protein